MRYHNYAIGHYKQGQFPIGDADASAPDKIVHVFDGDVTTTVYELPHNFDRADFENWVGAVFGSPDEEDRFIIEYL